MVSALKRILMTNVGWTSDKRRDNHGQHQKSVIPDWELPDILYLFETECMSYRNLAYKYGVSHITIKRKIDKCKKWIEEGTFKERTQPPQSWDNLR